MTRQEEIREEVIKIIHKEDNPFPFEPDWEDEDEDGKAYYYEYIDRILSYLHSQGVVIKVGTLGVTHPHLSNYYSVEPLIEDKE